MSSKFLFTLTSLIGLSYSLPASHLVARNPWQECSPGTWYSSCSNGYQGCYPYDPCNLPAISPAPPSNTKTSVPQMYNLYFLQGAHDTDALNHLDVRTKTQRALARFDDVPAGAKKCVLKWRQPADITKRSLKVTESGAVYTRQLTGFPAETEKVNPVTLAPFVNGAGEYKMSMDFTGWEDVEGSTPHIGPSLDCSVTPVVVELSAEQLPGKSGEVFIDNQADDGLFLEYEV